MDTLNVSSKVFARRKRVTYRVTFVRLTKQTYIQLCSQRRRRLYNSSNRPLNVFTLTQHVANTLISKRDEIQRRIRKRITSTVELAKSGRQVYKVAIETAPKTRVVLLRMARKPTSMEHDPVCECRFMRMPPDVFSKLLMALSDNPDDVPKRRLVFPRALKRQLAKRHGYIKNGEQRAIPY
jgi:hypothetical protein